MMSRVYRYNPGGVHGESWDTQFVVLAEPATKRGEGWTESRQTILVRPAQDRSAKPFLVSRGMLRVVRDVIVQGVQW